jgi:hypothetical protein
MAALKPHPAHPASERSPDGIPAAARRRAGSPRQAALACLVGAIVLGLLAPPDLPAWAERLGATPAGVAARETVAAWRRDAAAFDLSLPHRVLHRATQWLLERQWP